MKYAYETSDGTWFQLPLKKGTKIKFVKEYFEDDSESPVYIVRASNIAFHICSTEGNEWYTIVDFNGNERGPEDLVFGHGTETDEDCEKMLDRMTAGTSAISRRHNAPLKIEWIEETLRDGTVRTNRK